MMKAKRFIFEINNEIYDEICVGVSKDANIIFSGDVNEELPDDVKQKAAVSRNKKEKQKKLSIAYDEMVKDVYDEMLKVFGTRNDSSASAYAATYEAMAKRPNNYVGAGFADATAVINYANERIAAIDAYAVFRIKRIEQYRLKAAEIQNA